MKRDEFVHQCRVGNSDLQHTAIESQNSGATRDAFAGSTIPRCCNLCVALNPRQSTAGDEFREDC